MTVELYAAFVAAVTVLMLIPGPNVALITAQSIAHGPRRGLATVAGTSAAMVLQLGLVGLGMTGAMAVAGHWFAILGGPASPIWSSSAFRPGGAGRRLRLPAASRGRIARSGVASSSR